MWFLIFCLSFIHTFPFSFSFFLFFSLAFCPPHTYTHRIPSSLFFLYIPLDSKAFLSPYFSSSLILCSLFLFFFLFLFLLDSIYSLALSVILDSIILLAFWCHYLQSSNTHTDMHRERRNRLCSTTPPPLLLLLTAECMQPGVISASIFFPCSWLVVVSDFRFVKSASIFFSWSFIVVLIFFSVLNLLLLLLFWF